MPLLPAQAVEEFEDIWKRQFGVELPRDEAVVKAQQLYGLVRQIVTTDLDAHRESSSATSIRAGVLSP
jgi:hypothetical protein